MQIQELLNLIQKNLRNAKRALHYGSVCRLQTKWRLDYIPCECQNSWKLPAALIVSLLPFSLNLGNFNHRQMKVDSERQKYFGGNTQMGYNI